MPTHQRKKPADSAGSGARLRWDQLSGWITEAEETRRLRRRVQLNAAAAPMTGNGPGTGGGILTSEMFGPNQAGPGYVIGSLTKSEVLGYASVDELGLVYQSFTNVIPAVEIGRAHV